MLPSAHLTQGAFEDMDLILADNFARAAAKAGVSRIVYLGGLVPEGIDLSRHLRSRLEVESALGSRGVPVTALRAGIVVGRGGSSFEMLLRLLERLPFIPCPPWALTPSQPIALRDALDLLAYCLQRPGSSSEGFDIGGPEVLPYRDMLKRIAALRGIERPFVGIPLPGPLWYGRALAWATGYPRELVDPLVESMRVPMLARDRRLQEEAGVPGLGFDAAVRSALEASPPEQAPRRAAASPLHNVRSVQRMPLPPGRSARWAAGRYGEFLTRTFRSLIRAESDSRDNVRLLLAWPRWTLLEHVFAHDRNSAPDRQVFYITGGLLAREDRRRTRRARLEFREAPAGACLLVAVHDYRPSLPWWLYSLVQAPLHLWIMRLFASRLNEDRS
jgi:uncharacterized protein YbjT (DUF2867 family)